MTASPDRAGLREAVEAAIIEHRDSIWPAQLRAVENGGGWTYEAHLARYLTEYALAAPVAVDVETAQRLIHEARGHGWPWQECGSCNDRASTFIENRDLIATRLPEPVPPDRKSIDEQVDELERILQPRGRCTECGGGEFYWKHMGEGDPLAGYHLFQPPLPEPVPPDRKSMTTERAAGLDALAARLHNDPDICDGISHASWNKPRKCERVAARLRPMTTERAAGLRELSDRIRESLDANNVMEQDSEVGVLSVYEGNKDALADDLAADLAVTGDSEGPGLDFAPPLPEIDCQCGACIYLNRKQAERAAARLRDDRAGT